jgi:hypothetical protein
VFWRGKRQNFLSAVKDRGALRRAPYPEEEKGKIK